MFSSVSLLPIQSNRLFLAMQAYKIDFSKIRLVCKEWMNGIDLLLKQNEVFEWEKRKVSVKQLAGKDYSLTEMGEQALLYHKKGFLTFTSIHAITLDQLEPFRNFFHEFCLEKITNRFFVTWWNYSWPTHHTGGFLWDVNNREHLHQFYEETKGEMLFTDHFYIIKPTHQSIKILSYDKTTSYEFTFDFIIEDFKEAIFLKAKNALLLSSDCHGILCLDLNNKTHFLDPNKHILDYPLKNYGNYLCNFDESEKSIYLFDPQTLENHLFKECGESGYFTCCVDDNMIIYVDETKLVKNIHMYNLDLKERMILTIPNAYLEKEVEMIWVSTHHCVIDLEKECLLIDRKGHYVHSLPQIDYVDGNYIVFSDKTKFKEYNLITEQKF
ncbi:hypothetical protein BN1013_01532 [Candidatus Rubidus massiliensis]|nr:hypothetical protein BN1013_01532 [Candidatus Rubidus massiliensis]